MLTAQATGRTLILPPIWCNLDRFWTIMDHCLIGKKVEMPLPFVCPLDHSFLLPAFFNAGLDFREPSSVSNRHADAPCLRRPKGGPPRPHQGHPFSSPGTCRHSFLTNPRVPASLRASRVRLRVGDAAAAAAAGLMAEAEEAAAAASVAVCPRAAAATATAGMAPSGDTEEAAAAAAVAAARASGGARVAAGADFRQVVEALGVVENEILVSPVTVVQTVGLC